MPAIPKSRQIASLRQSVHPLSGAATDYDPLLDLVGDAELVLIGEATHGTHEFYRERAEITKRLITEKGFAAVAVEADWPDAYRVNRYVRGAGKDTSARKSLANFKRFPAWMWRNAVVVDFVEWLHDHNKPLPADSRAGFYGLDLYSLHTSIAHVISYLDVVDPAAAERARRRYSCFEHFGSDVEAYGWATSAGIVESCEDEVVDQLKDLQQRIGLYRRRDGRLAEDEAFYAEQNARLVRNAEEYYRAMFRSGAVSWNLRDRHMVQTLESLIRHFESQGRPSKIVVWEHNSHVGDARGTEASATGEWNVGQLVSEKYGDRAILVGFTTYTGTVTAASEWGLPAERKWVRPALRGSYEELFHLSEMEDFLLILRGKKIAADLANPRLERAVGVIYLPESERVSHYFYARLPEQFDAIIHIDETTAVEPLERTSEWIKGEVPEAFPSGV